MNKPFRVCLPSVLPIANSAAASGQKTEKVGGKRGLKSIHQLRKLVTSWIVLLTMRHKW